MGDEYPISDGEIRSMLRAANSVMGNSWHLDLGTSGTVIMLLDDDGPHVLRVRRDRMPASDGDMVFVANAKDDVTTLANAVLSGTAIPSTVLDAIRERVENASASPWRSFVEEDGGLGGESVIWVSHADAEPDMYLILDDHSAPASVYRFVADARNELPRLVKRAMNTPPTG